jgi:hypothetical protein
MPSVPARQWGGANGCAFPSCAPGIYAADRLPVERLQKGLPALGRGDDVSPTTFMPMIWRPPARRAAPRAPTGPTMWSMISDLKMAEYFDRVADAFALPRPPRSAARRPEATLSPMQMSFMRESRRIGNRRLKNELKLRLAYPTVDDGIAEACARRNACSS